MKNLFTAILLGLFTLCLFLPKASAHCEIPCGIYDDEMRMKMIKEHITTIEKSMNQIMKIEKGEQTDFNQLVRWITNKEHHANEIQEIVTQYFMTQRIKFETDNYDKKLGLLHQMLVYSMKCKQTTDLNQIKKLRSVVEEFYKLYFE